MTKTEVQALREKRLDKWNAAKEFLDSHTDKNGQISDEAANRYLELEKEIRELDNAIELHTSANAREDEYNQLTTTPIYSYGKISSGLNIQSEYKQKIVKAMRGKFRDLSVTNQLMTTNSGGYLLDSEMNAEIITRLAEENPLREISHVIQTATEHKIPILTDAPKSSWVAEGAPINFATDTSYSSITLSAYKLAVAAKVTNELLFDSAYNLWEHVEKIFVEEIARAEQEAMINGAGTNAPKGIIETLSGLTDTLLTTSSTSITADDIIDLVYSLDRAYRKNAVFLMSDSTAAVLRKIKTADLDYIWQQNYTSGEPETLCGFKVYTSPYMPKIESGKIPIIFGDFSYFYIADRGTRSMRELVELFAANDLTGFLLTERVDCAVVQNAAFKAIKIK